MSAAPGLPDATRLRSGAEALAGPLPPLLAEAERLAASVLPGGHGRRRSGPGDEFWQYRAATSSDPASRIDWRRSARSDAHFVRETEWQTAQTVTLWVDSARAMEFSSDRARPPKAERARLVALAAAVLLIRAGERVGLMRPAALPLPPRTGQAQLGALAQALAADADDRDYGAPDGGLPPAHSRAVFLSDFLGDLDPVEAALTSAADRGVRGALVQVLDPAEESFPYDGRAIFESMQGGLRHETLRAGDLRERYRDRLAARKDRLEALGRLTGWQVSCHHTDTPASVALMWLWHALAARETR